MSNSHLISGRCDGAYQSADDLRENFGVNSPIEIQFILKAIQQEKSLLSLFPERSSQFLLSSILAIEPARNLLLIDPGNDPAINERVLKANIVTCVSMQNRVKIEFCCEKLQLVEFEGRPTFAARIPSSLLRFQRRNFYRIMTPVSNPATCLFSMLVNHDQRSEAIFNLLDISCGGMALIDQHHALDLEPGKIFAECQLNFPGAGEVVVTAAVRNSCSMTLKNGLSCQRVGCEFINLPEDSRILIQRYIIRLEQQERQFRRDG